MVDWLSIDKTSGSSGKTKVTITASTYSELIQRVTTLTVKAGSLSEDISIAQNPYVSGIVKVNPTNLIFSSKGETLTITIDAQKDWTWTEFPDWIGVSEQYVTGGTAGHHVVALTALPNTETVPKNGRFVIKCGEDYAFINCTQGRYVPPTDITVNPTLLEVPQSGEQYQIAVTCSGYWRIKELPSWCSVSVNEGIGNATVTVNITENADQIERLGDIVFTDESQERTARVEIIQEAEPYLIVNPIDVVYGQSSGTTTVSIVSNSNWNYSLSSSQSWCTVTRRTTGLDLTFKNNTGSTRSFQITVTNAKGLSEVVNVSQNAYALSITPTSVDVAGEGGTFYFDIICNGNWTASVSGYPDDIHLDKTSGNGNTTIAVTVDPNTTSNKHTSSLRVSDGSRSVSASIVQRVIAPELSIIPTTLIFDPHHLETQMAQLTADQKWYTSSNAPWVNVDPTTYSRGWNISFTSTSLNYTPDDRNDAIEFYANKGGERFSVYVNCLMKSVLSEVLGSNGAITCTYNITDISAPTDILAHTGWASSEAPVNKLKVMIIDGNIVPISELSNFKAYQFDSVGEHTVKFYFIDETDFSYIVPMHFGEGVTAMTSVDIGDDITKWERNTFDGATSLKDITIGTGITYIPSDNAENPFRNTPSRETIVVRSGNKVYDSRNNCNCLILTAQNRILLGAADSTIPNTITHIGGWGSASYTHTEAFQGIQKPFSIYMPDSVVELSEGDALTGINGIFKESAIEDVRLSHSLTELKGTFMGCNNIKYIEIPDSVTFLARTFVNCNSLVGVTLGSGLTQIDYDSEETTSAFNNLPSLSFIYAKCNEPIVGEGYPYRTGSIKWNGTLYSDMIYPTWFKNDCEPYGYLGIYGWTKESASNFAYLDIPEINSLGGNAVAKVYAEGAWTATTDTSWINLNTTSGSGIMDLSFNYTENNSRADRTGSITITLPNGTSKTFSFTQKYSIVIRYTTVSGNIIPNEAWVGLYKNEKGYYDYLPLPITSNTYEGGTGILVFSEETSSIGLINKTYAANADLKSIVFPPCFTDMYSFFDSSIPFANLESVETLTTDTVWGWRYLEAPKLNTVIIHGAPNDDSASHINVQRNGTIWHPSGVQLTSWLNELIRNYGWTEQTF